MLSTGMAKFMMKMFEARPTFSEKNVGDLSEVFSHEAFVSAGESKQKAIMLKSSESKYKGELQYPWDNYFGFNLSPMLADKVVLDLGCFTGGRSVAWFEKYKMRKIYGIDVDQIYIDAAAQFAEIHNVSADFRLAFGETLPYEDAAFDAILSMDVFEHVRSVQKTLNECYRVLKPGGKLLLVFPGYFQPIEHHLGMVTRMPGIHWLFAGKTLVKAYSEILDERGVEANWYKRSSSVLQPWEKGHTINGTTFGSFKKMVKGMDWKRTRYIHVPIGSIGRNISRNKFIPTLSKLLIPLTFMPGVREIFLHRITCILEK